MQQNLTGQAKSYRSQSRPADMTEAQNFCCPEKYYINKKIPF